MLYNRCQKPIEILQNENELDDRNITYENFVKAHREAVLNCIPLKPIKRKRVPWETPEIQIQRKKIRCSAIWKNENPGPQNVTKFNREKQKMTKLYQAELENYLQNKIALIKTYLENKQSSMAWDTINEITGRKRTSKAKLRAESQQDRLSQWKSHFENLLGKAPTTLTQQTIETLPGQNDSNIKVGPFNDQELNKALSKIKNGKASGLDGIPPEVWKTKHFNDILLKCCNDVYNQKPVEYRSKGCILPFPKKGDLGKAENQRGITLTSIAAKIYNMML